MPSVDIKHLSIAHFYFNSNKFMGQFQRTSFQNTGWFYQFKADTRIFWFYYMYVKKYVEFFLVLLNKRKYESDRLHSSIFQRFVWNFNLSGTTDIFEKSTKYVLQAKNKLDGAIHLKV